MPADLSLAQYAGEDGFALRETKRGFSRTGRRLERDLFQRFSGVDGYGGWLLPIRWDGYYGMPDG